MEGWIEWARGPLFQAALIFMVLGLLRHAALTVWEMARAVRRAGDKSIPYRKVAAATLGWLVPARKAGNRWPVSLTSFAFHVAIIVTPLFLAGHIALWRRGVGLSWPAIPGSLADVLTVLAVVTAVILMVERAAARASRVLSRFEDYALPVVIAVPFASGFLVTHPGASPFSFESVFLVHILSADLLLILIPLTKLSHMILLPGTQLVSELAWHFPPDAGHRVAVILGKENQPI